MRRIGLPISVFLFMTTSSFSQIGAPVNSMSEGITQCINESSQSNTTRLYKGRIYYSCSGQIGSWLYDYLADSTTTKEEKYRGGIFRARHYGTLNCFQHVENADGSPASGVHCEVNMASPD